MTRRHYLITFVAFLAGCLVSYSYVRWTSWERQFDIARHWANVNTYNAYMSDPENYKPDPTGLTELHAANVPFDPEPSLAALTAEGELQHVDLVFPLVPANREANLHWMRFVNERPHSILYATGNPEYTYYQTSGAQPLHLNLWFKESARTEVRQLIEELEALARQPASPESK